MKARQTGPDAFERQKKLSHILNQRLSGKSLREIGEAQNPLCSAQAIFKTVKKGLAGIVPESVAEIRALEAGRLDELQNAVWPQAKAGDMQAVNCVLSIMQRRARLLGLDLRPALYGSGDSDAGDAADPHTVRVEIINSPEVERTRWLEERHQRLCEIEAGETETPYTRH